MRKCIYGLLLTMIVSGIAAATPSIHPVDTVKRPTRKNGNTDTLGRYLEVQRIVILGNKLTRNSIILRELSLKKGDVINETYLPEILEKDKRKLFNLRLFHTTNIRAIESGYNQVDLLIEVEERWYFFPFPIFKLSDRNFNEWWQNYDHDFDRVNYGIRLRHTNMRGRREDLLFIAQLGFERKLQLQYAIPYINKKQKQGLILQMDYIESKNVADSTILHKLDFIKYEKILRTTKGIGLTYTYRNNFYNQHRLKYEYRHTAIADTLQRLNPNYLGNENNEQRFDAITYEFISDHRDVVSYPLKGYLLYLHASQNGVALRKDLNKTEGFASFASFIDLTNNFYVSNLSYTYLSTPDRIPYFNYGAMGYDKIFIRGYEIYVIEGSGYFLSKTTFKKRIFSRVWDLNPVPVEQFRYFPLAIYLKAYADFGYVDNYPAYTENSINTKLADKFLGGAGMGLDFASAYDFVLRLEYTFTSQHTSGFFLHIKKEF